MTFKDTMRRILPETVKSAIRPAYHLLTGASRIIETLPEGVSSSDELLPPPALQAYIGGGFRGVGPELLRYFQELCDLKPDESVLDVGCGSGRMALPLTGYLSDRGRYEGFDISAKAINWCRKNITGRYPNFRFQAFNIRNAPYNPLGTIRVSSYRFPYEDETFDLIFLASVFTHMLPGDVKHYLSEIARVLKPGGRCLITYFLLNAESSRMIDKKLGTINFEYHMGDYRTINQDRPEDAMAYYEVFVRNLYRKHGLKIMEPVRYGSWCGRETYLSFQDIIIAVKAEALS